MSTSLTPDELVRLVERVFQPTEADHGLAVLADLPDGRRVDTPDWGVRRALADAWARMLLERRETLGLQRVSMVWYRNAGSNNADLPEVCWATEPGVVPAHARELQGRDLVSFPEVFTAHSIILALTELSATAPLKVAARGGAFRAATMPGFLPSMVPALRIDYGEVDRRVRALKARLDRAGAARLVWEAAGVRHELTLDLRHREAHASGGLLPENGAAGNLPSGEAYIVPYEGEIAGDPSRSAGTIPVEFDGEIVVYEVQGNRAVSVLSRGPRSEEEARLLAAEPAYANLAELGLGVLGDFGLEPTGSILLDEKLGLHVAFGRSDHFGGMVGPDAFSRPEAVVHLDRVYIPGCQPQIAVKEVVLADDGGERVLMRDGAWVDAF
ncbi:MAG: hypothetical protein R6X25_06560 [Candidatus Krumholzibacteriia bacterium]